MRGVVSGVRDYGNRMGIPTVNGAVYFDERYLGNPLVYCGNVGLIAARQIVQGAEAGRFHRGDRRPHRARRHSRSHVQLGRADQPERERFPAGRCRSATPIEEKMVLDVLLAARDRGLFHAVTDCGAGGFQQRRRRDGREDRRRGGLDRAR